jgi:hypothetical protein
VTPGSASACKLNWKQLSASSAAKPSNEIDAIRHSLREEFCDPDHSGSNVACDRLDADGNESGCSHHETEYCDDEGCNSEPKRHPSMLDQLRACGREEPWEFAEDITSHEQRLAREPRFDLRHDHQACEDCVNIYGTHAEL